jgi:tRNA(fMet)-specific endonuclease VapC
MKYLLDTNVCIKYLNGQSESIVNKFYSLNPYEIVICSVVKGELFAGVYKSKSFDKSYKKLISFLEPFPTIEFDDNAAEKYGEVRAELEKIGKPIGPYDLQIASIAITNELILVTHNVKEFSRIKELKIEDWEVN